MTHVPLKIGLLTFVVGLFAAMPVAAQDTDLLSAKVTTCGVSTTVVLTIGPVTLVQPLPCGKQAQVNDYGEDDESIAKVRVAAPYDINVTVDGLVNLAAERAVAPGDTVLTAESQASDFNLLDGFIEVTGLDSFLECTARKGNTALTCNTHVQGANVSVNGQSIAVPSPVPPNFTIPVPSVNVSVDVPLVGTVQVPVGGTLVLNETVVTGPGTVNVTVEHHGIHLAVGGGVQVAGAGLVKVNANVTDDETFNLNTALAHVITDVFVN
ncbi:hypothetical protein FHW69_002675 [Luteibacter sp. Sphag1AF]|uniref:choice-of-anchor P family protein n=1 Tax=Luteibacter sp. Sphag1AF TaxID=2587031 RepID=UPI001610FBD1|nr:choice-of-anchor P family protein [Luteibacter sp. Sphag1AF]MBB3228040.1 hypothetical protein [Luteibacter sp. Sphag1AF]